MSLPHAPDSQESASRNEVPPEIAEVRRSEFPGLWTFHAPIRNDYFGNAMTVACVRLGDHAHIDIDTGRHNPSPVDYKRGTVSRGYAGRLVMRWPEWEMFRALLDSAEWVEIAEVENPTQKQLNYHTRDVPAARDVRDVA